MMPILARFQLPWLGNIVIAPFFTTILLGALVLTLLVYRLFRANGIPPIVAIDMGIIGLVASAIGSRIFHVLFEYPLYYWEDPWRVFDVMSGGFVSLGAYIASVAAFYVYLRRRRMAVLPIFDQVARVVPVIIFFTRLGCFLTGCCYGRPTDSMFGIIFPPGSTAYYFLPGVAVHPYQLYDMINSLAMLVVLHLFYRRRKFLGQITAMFFILLGASRFLLEYFRGDEDRGVYLKGILTSYGISTGQIVMLIFLTLGIVMYRHWQRAANSKSAPAADPATPDVSS